MGFAAADHWDAQVRLPFCSSCQGRAGVGCGRGRGPCGGSVGYAAAGYWGVSRVVIKSRLLHIETLDLNHCLRCRFWMQCLVR